jgi:hypothetical protein
MYESVPVPQLLDEWLAWARWMSLPDRDESEAGNYTGFDEMCWVVEREPEKAWSAILQAVEDPRFEQHLPALAANAMEDLLAYHGPLFIERVEAQASRDGKFAWLLGGVWKYTMTEEIWQRVQKVWDRRGWDEVPGLRTEQAVSANPKPPRRDDA